MQLDGEEDGVVTTTLQRTNWVKDNIYKVAIKFGKEPVGNTYYGLWDCFDTLTSCNMGGPLGNAKHLQANK
jgi:hypothetical protein